MRIRRLQILLEAVKLKFTLKMLHQKKKFKSSRWTSEDCLEIWIERSQRKIWKNPSSVSSSTNSTKEGGSIRRSDQRHAKLEISQLVSDSESRRNSEVAMQKDGIQVYQILVSDFGYQTSVSKSNSLVSDSTFKKYLHLVSDATQIEFRFSQHQTQHRQIQNQAQSKKEYLLVLDS